MITSIWAGFLSMLFSRQGAKRRPQSGGKVVCPVRTFYGQGGHFTDIFQLPLIGWKKASKKAGPD